MSPNSSCRLPAASQLPDATLGTFAYHWIDTARNEHTTTQQSHLSRLLYSPNCCVNWRRFYGPLFPGSGVQLAVHGLPPHPLFHVLTPAVAFFGAVAILGASIAFGPYLRGEKWAWWSLLLADLAVILTNVWGTLAIYVHSISNGIISELSLPLILCAIAILLSWRDFNSSKRATT